MGRTMLRYGMVGGDLDAFIGGVHREAIAINEDAHLEAGCFSASDEESNLKCAAHYHLAPDRVYRDFDQMAQAEAERTDDRLDFVSICTPNRFHYQAAKAFLEKGFNVICEKPLCFEIDEARELEVLAKKNDVLFAVAYTYTGYNMVKQAREMISDGAIGRIIDVKAVYLSQWLLDEADEDADRSQGSPVWRMDPEISGISNCVGDIGTHIECTVSYMTGLRVKRLMCVLDRFSHPLDLNANMIVEFDNGAHGTFSCSQVTAGHYNDLSISIFGTKGSIVWHAEHPEELEVTMKEMPTQIYTRAAHTSGQALRINRFPSGHPEGLVMAFANLYKAFTGAILNRINGDANDGRWDLDFPDAGDGVRGVEFVHACVESSDRGGVWIEL